LIKQTATTMRKIIVAMSVTLDGYVEGPNHDMSWMRTDSQQDWEDLFEMLESVDLLLLGGGMFEEYRDYWKQSLTSPKASPNEVKYARWAERHKHIVFSKTIKDPRWENASINNGNSIEEVKKIKSQPGKDIYVVGGAKFASAILDAKLADELRLVVNPWLLGAGKSLYNGNHNRHSLKLIETKKMEGNTVLVRYGLTHES
jgi:dihydrofolate reductase